MSKARKKTSTATGRGAVRRGKSRLSPATGRRYRATLYLAPRARVSYVDPETRSRRMLSVPRGDDADAFFERIEAALDAHVALADTDPKTNIRRDMRALGLLYIEWLENQGRTENYVANVECVLNRWINPLIGHVLVAEWGSNDSLKVVAAARKVVADGRVEAIGTALSGLRATAQRRHSGVRWMELSEDPLGGVHTSAASTTHGDEAMHVPPSNRPSAKQVATAIHAADLRDATCSTRTGLQLRIAAFQGLRLGEQLGLRAIDVIIEDRQLHVNGSWKRQRARTNRPTSAPYRGPTKTRKDRRVPYRASDHAGIVRACADAMGLARDSTEVQVIAAIQVERDRRTDLLGTQKGKRWDGRPARAWWEVTIPPDEEFWLFTPPGWAIPWTNERFNDEWHRVRRVALGLAQGPNALSEGWVEWPRRIRFRNMRHYAATFLHSIGIEWETVADFLGHSVKTCLARYVRKGDDADAAARSALDLL